MTEDERYDRGREVFKRIHGDVIPQPNREMGAFSEISVRNIYNDVWGREVMSVRDRRLLVMGALAAMSLTEPLEIHLRSALELKELTQEELDEISIALSPYIGAPRAAYVLKIVKKIKSKISKFNW
jgi:4-carboxymuconolactone decarboxylase